MFEDLSELETVFQQLDESCKYPPEDGLEWICGETSLLIKHVDQLLQAVEKIERKHGMRAGTSYQSEILATLWGVLRDCDSSIELRARLDDLKLLLLKAMVIGVELKSDGLVLLVGKGNAFTYPPPRGQDNLSKALLEILKRLGKSTPMKALWRELERMAKADDEVIEEVTEGSVWWKSGKGKPKQTAYRTVETSLGNLRKKI
jgi:hypothetical protein